MIRHVLALILLMWLPLTCFADYASKFYMGFAIKGIFGGEDIGIMFSQHGVDDTDEAWTTPPAGSPYTYLYAGMPVYQYSSGVSSAVEFGRYWSPGLFLGIEALYMNYEASDDDSSIVLINNALSVLFNAVYFRTISTKIEFSVYVGGGLGFGLIKLTDTTYVLDNLLASSNPMPNADGSYAYTEIYPKGVLDSGSKWELGYQIKGGIGKKLDDNIFASIGLFYYGSSNIADLSNIDATTSPATVALLESGSHKPAEVTMRSGGFTASDFSFSDYGGELSVRIVFDD